MNDTKVIASPVRGYVKSFEETDNEIIIPVIGIPFGSQEERDLHNEYFDKSTDVGNLSEVMVYFNHNQFYPASDDPEELQKSAYLARAFRGEILGIARKAETTDEGIIYNIVLDKRKQYVSALYDMVKDNLLDVSSGAKYRETDPNESGRISKWHTVEISFTPSPANPNAVPLTKSILEKALEETKMPEEKAPELVADVAGVDETLIPDSVKSAFAEIAPQKQEEPTVVPALLEEIAVLKSQNEALTTQIGEIITAVKSIQATLPYMIKSFGEIFRQETAKSTFEVQAQKSVNTPTAPKPTTPPTANKRPVFDGKAGSIMKAPGK